MIIGMYEKSPNVIAQTTGYLWCYEEPVEDMMYTIGDYRFKLFQHDKSVCLELKDKDMRYSLGFDQHNKLSYIVEYTHGTTVGSKKAFSTDPASKEAIHTQYSTFLLGDMWKHEIKFDKAGNKIEEFFDCKDDAALSEEELNTEYHTFVDENKVMTEFMNALQVHDDNDPKTTPENNALKAYIMDLLAANIHNNVDVSDKYICG